MIDGQTARRHGHWDSLWNSGSVSVALNLPAVDSRKSLELFLQRYKTNVLLPRELPCIFHACQHAAGNELRELIALDREIHATLVCVDFARASRRIGQSQLKR